MHLQPFMPAFGQTQTLTPGAASANVTFGKGSKQFMIYNTGTNVAYIRYGVGAQTATAADFPVRPGANPIALSKPEEADNLAHISPLGATLVICPGEGWM